MKKYGKYKNTQVPWYSSIPESWVVCKVKHVAKTYAGGTPSTDNNNYWEGGNIPWLPSGKLQNCDITTAEKFITEEGLNNSSTKWIKPNTTLIALTGATCANIGYLKFKACANQSVVAIDEYPDKANSRYIYYMLLSMRMQILTHQTGGAQAGINDGDVKNLFIALPSIAEQSTIALYLDHQTAIIDALIQKKEKLIELLKEKRQSVINHAVTKGLNPNAKLKPSGIEWLGDVPEHWSVVAVNKVIEVKDGTHDTPLYIENETDCFPLVTSKDFVNGEIDFNKAKYISKSDHLEIIKRSNTEKGDILMSMIGGNIGNLMFVSTDKEFSIKNVALFKTSHSNDLGRYLYYILKSDLLRVQIDLQSKGGAQGFLSLSDIRKLVFLKMPEGEMKAIVAYLDEYWEKAEKAIQSILTQIEKIKEYRQSIISEAVTGRVDLRDWKPVN